MTEKKELQGQGLWLKDQYKDKDLSAKDQEQDFTVKDKEFNLALKESWSNITGEDIKLSKEWEAVGISSLVVRVSDS